MSRRHSYTVAVEYDDSNDEPLEESRLDDEVFTEESRVSTTVADIQKRWGLALTEKEANKVQLSLKQAEVVDSRQEVASLELQANQLLQHQYDIGGVKVEKPADDADLVTKLRWMDDWISSILHPDHDQLVQDTMTKLEDERRQWSDIKTALSLETKQNVDEQQRIHVRLNKAKRQLVMLKNKRVQSEFAAMEDRIAVVRHNSRQLEQSDKEAVQLVRDEIDPNFVELNHLTSADLMVSAMCNRLDVVMRVNQEARRSLADQQRKLDEVNRRLQLALKSPPATISSGQTSPIGPIVSVQLGMLRNIRASLSEEKRIRRKSLATKTGQVEDLRAELTLLQSQTLSFRNIPASFLPPNDDDEDKIVCDT